MKSTTLYGLSKCSTCVKARDWLSAHGVAHEFVDYRDHPVTAATLKAWAGKVGGWEKLVNRTSMTWRALSDERKAASTDAQWTQLIAEYPALVRRPSQSRRTARSRSASAKALRRTLRLIAQRMAGRQFHRAPRGARCFSTATPSSWRATSWAR